MYTVTRQNQWPEGAFVVEVSAGGIDYTNPDALTARYAGEFETYQDAREAIETAIDIAETWQQDILNARRLDTVFLGFGATGGFTMPFDTLPLTPAVKRYLRNVARHRYDAAPKCDGCGEILPENGKRYSLIDDHDSAEYCSEACAEKAFYQAEEDRLTFLCEEAGLDLEAARDYAAENNLTFDGFASAFYGGAICSEL